MDPIITKQLIDNIINRLNEKQSLPQLTHFIQNATFDPKEDFDSLRVIVESDIVRIAVQNMIYHKNNNEYIIILKNYSSFLRCLSTLGRNIGSYEALLSLFDSFVMDLSVNDTQRFIILDLFANILYSRDWKHAIRKFYTLHFEPTALKCKLNNYSLFCRLYYLFNKFHQYMGGQNNVISLAQKLSVDPHKMAQCIVNEIYRTDSKIKYTQMLDVLVDMVKKEQIQQERKDLLNVRNDAFKHCLRDLFDTFAANADGTMSVMDCRRYILACGAGHNSASQGRIRRIFDGKHSLSFDSLFAFYTKALLDRPDHVWSDLHVFGYNTQLVKGDQVQHSDSVYQFLKHNDKYAAIVGDYFDVNQGEYPTLKWYNLRISLPFPQQLLQKMIDFENAVDLLDFNIEEKDCKSLYRVLYILCNLETICVHKDNEWRKKFVQNKAWDHLFKLYLKYCLISESDEHIYECADVYHLGIGMLFKIMHNICHHLSCSISINKFMHNAYDHTLEVIENKHVFKHLLQSMKDILSLKQNYMIHLKAMDAKLGSESNIGVLNVIPYQITMLYTEVLISGYIKTCKLSLNIPQALSAMMCFFL